MRGGTSVNKVILKKDTDDFIVLVDDKDALQKWKKDSSVPLAQVVGAFKVYTTRGGGSQGGMDTAPKALLESAFGSKNEDDVIKTILTEGNLQVSDTPTRESSTNDSKGSMANHR
ncbi:hypothetical protein TWF694_009737 [Orbilia ellipsospora]|uniref:Ribosome maturation protein SDO1/SBDS N-terminal domain-containing protein n=1 Tax=Orbilia ellipsospora TaxID=2528407 RepID=A0AAV9XC35_9PEZI